MRNPKNILVLTYWSYKEPLIQAYTLPYVRLIREQLGEQGKIFLLTLEKTDLTPNQAELNEIRQNLKAEGIELIPFPYHRFGLKAILSFGLLLPKLALLCTRNNISNIHCWCTPAGALGYLLSVFTGIPLILDSYEPHAESMVENGAWKPNGLAYKILFWLEKKQSKKAAHVIALTEGMREYARLRYQTGFKSYFVKPACVPLERFNSAGKSEQLAQSLGTVDHTICIYAGKFGGIYLEAEVFDFFKSCYDHWNGKFKALVLSDAPREYLHELCAKTGFPSANLIMLSVPHYQVPSYMALADFALNPVKPVPTKKYCTSIKDGEYWAMGLPVAITPGISDDSEIIVQNNIGAVIQSLNKEGYLGAIKKIQLLLDDPQINDRARETAKQYRSFEIAKNIYRKIYG